MRGRKPLPSNVVRLRGNPGKRRLNDAEPRPASKVPACPTCLGEEARKEWKRLAKELAELGLLTGLDRAMLAAYCQAHALGVEAVSSIERYGTMVKSPNGYPMQSPYVAVANKQVEIMVRIAAELGMTPSSRTRIRVGERPPEDPFETFCDRGTDPHQPPRPSGLRAPPRRPGAGSGSGPTLRSRCRAPRDRVLRLPSPQQRRVGRPALRACSLASVRRRLPVRLEALGWPPSLPHRLLRGTAEERQIDPLGIGLYLLVADGEQGAEIYSAATSRDQARIVFEEAKRMVTSSPALKRRVEVLINNLNIATSASRFMPLSSDASTMDGLNVHGAIIDELHAHRTRHVVDVLETATGARRQPLLFEITTAGYDRHSICYEHHDYSIKLLEGVLQDDSWFALIAAADEGADWTDPEVWRKANPSFGLSVKEDDLARKAEKAIALPGAQNAFRRMHLNEWTEQAERWIDLAAWDACSIAADLENLRGRRCFGGLDLSTTTDVTALAWVFPPDDDDGLWHVLSRYFVPEENLRRRAERDRVPYDLWTRQGFIEATPGNVVDYSAIEERIRADAALFDVKEIAYDPWNATHIALRLQDEGAKMIEFRQGFRSMAAPTRELEKLIVSQKLAHGGNPVTRWMAANVAVNQDAAGNLKPAKDKSTDRIDGIVALIMAIGRAMLPQEPTFAPFMLILG